MSQSGALTKAWNAVVNKFLAVSALRGKSPGLGVIVRELALEEAELSLGFHRAEHIPGFSNVWADALSRLSAPAPYSVPAELLPLSRVPLPPRGREWYMSLQLPSAGRTAGRGRTLFR